MYNWAHINIIVVQVAALAQDRSVLKQMKPILCTLPSTNNNQLITYYQRVCYLLKNTTIPCEYYLQ